jgi:CRISPR/Cas system-associated exonuclease Cas4 (RecB family)
MDFQLIFYYVLLKESGAKVDLKNLYYYNLTNGKMSNSKRTLKEFDDVLEKLKQLEKGKIDFAKNPKCNQFCPYKTICNI